MSALDDLTTSAAPESAYSFTAPYSTVHIPAFDIEDHIGMRAGQLAALLPVIPVADYSSQMLSLAGRLANELDAPSDRRQADVLVAGQLAELLLRIQGEHGPCDLLWLAQQIADEILEIVTAMARNQNEGAPA